MCMDFDITSYSKQEREKSAVFIFAECNFTDQVFVTTSPWLYFVATEKETPYMLVCVMDARFCFLQDLGWKL